MKKTLNFISLFGFLAFSIYIAISMQPFGSPLYGIGDEIYNLFLNKTSALNSVTSIVFDFRAYDTLGEAIVLFTAVSGTIAVLRNIKKDKDSITDKMSVIVETVMATILPFTFVLGLYIILHGHLTPGGGFQGGVILASGIVLIFLAFGREKLCNKFLKKDFSKLESLGAILFLALGLMGILSNGSFFNNILDKGIAGNLFSSGTIFWLDIFVGLKVFAGMALIVLLFVKLHEIHKEDEE